ncbi:hypothetical protein WKK05_40575 (plasmid) [Nostoc sp. UHCC 0302]|uniref:hypothetical protein n=1 Tax=Nostoc sp. UHCC 0302 TaxID=3134896 RepID=UPI00311CD86A
MNYLVNFFKTELIRFLAIFYKDSYEADSSAGYLIIVLSIGFAVLHTNIREPKTYWNLLLPLPSLFLVSSKVQAKKEFQARQQKFQGKRNSQPLICRGCSRFNFLKIEDFNYCCQLHPTGFKGNICPDYESQKAFMQAWEIKHLARIKAHKEVEHLKPVGCQGCLNYWGIDDEDLKPMICSKHPNGFEGEKCPDKDTGFSPIIGFL